MTHARYHIRIHTNHCFMTNASTFTSSCMCRCCQLIFECKLFSPPFHTEADVDFKQCVSIKFSNYKSKTLMVRFVTPFNFPPRYHFPFIRLPHDGGCRGVHYTVTTTPFVDLPDANYMVMTAYIFF